MVRRISEMSRRGQKGFTLIELLVVIVILGILSAVVVFAVRGVGDKGSTAAYATDAKTLRTAEELFCAKNGRYGTEAELIAGKFLSEPSSYHKITLGGGGACTAAGVANQSSYTISCNTNAAGCGAGGAVGGTLVVGETFASNSTTNVASSTGGGTHAWWEIMYNGLIELDEAGNPAPELAVEVPTVANGGITNGGATYTLKLRPGVKWHDGTDFTANDVKFTFEKILLQFHARARNMNTPLGYVGAPTCTASNIVVVDPLTVRFSFTNPYVPFLKQLNVTEAAMNPANALPAFPPGSPGCPTQAQADAIKVGTGPFRFDSINSPQAGDGKVVKNPSYWKPGLPVLNAIVMRPYTSDAARYAALLNGDVDWVWDVPNPNVAALSANPAFKTASTQSLGGGPNSVDTFIFNLRASGSSVASVRNGTAPPHPILGDLDVRRAIFHALDRQQFLNEGRNGIGKVSAAPISSEIFGHATDIPLPVHSVSTANGLLDGAGWNGPRTGASGSFAGFRTALGHPTIADGTKLTLRFLLGSSAFNDRAAVMKANLAAVGIDLVITLNTTAGTGTGTATHTVFTLRNFDTYILNYAHGYDPHIGVRRQYHSDQISEAGTPNNAAGYRNTLVDADFDNAVRTIDATARFGFYHDFQERVVADLPYVWMIETPNVRGHTAQCTGFKAFTGLFAEAATCSS